MRFVSRSGERTRDGGTGVVFDLDGVLADSRAAIVASFRRALVARGHDDPGERRLAACIGPPPFVAIGGILGLAPDDPEVAAVVDAYRADYAPTFLDRTPAFAGIPEALTALSVSHRLAVATSKPHRYAAPLVDRLGIGDRILHVSAPRDDKRRSSKTGEVAEALAALGVRRAVMVGDRRFDIEAGHANGIAAIGVRWGIGDLAELEAAGADRIVDTPAELPAACEDLLADAMG